MLPKIYKSIELNIANFGHFTKNEYEVFEHLISKLNGTNSNGECLLPEQLQRRHILTAKEFSDLFEISLSQSYSVLKEAVDRLMEKSIRIQKLEGKGYKRINVCGSADYNTGEGYISVNFTDDIMPYLAQIRERFVLYNLKDITGLDSLYSIRLYGLIQEFKDTGWMLKSVDQLREAFAVPSDKLKTYNDFKKRTFAYACQELNKRHDLELRFEEEKKKRKVVKIKFFFKKTNPIICIESQNGIENNIEDQPLITELEHESQDMQSTFSPQVTQDLRNIFQLSDDRITELSSKYPESRVVETIELIKSKIARKEKIGNLVDCLRKDLQAKVIQNLSITVTDPQEEILGYKSETKKISSLKEVKETKNEKLNGFSREINQYLEAQPLIWRNICEKLLEDPGTRHVEFKNYFLNISFIKIADDKYIGKYLTLNATTSHIRDFVMGKYENRIKTAAQQFGVDINMVEIQSEGRL